MDWIGPYSLNDNLPWAGLGLVAGTPFLIFCSCEKAGGYSVDQLKTLCTNFTEAISKQSKVQQTSLKACLSLYLRSLQKRDPYLSAVAYVVHLSPDAITVTIPAYGISEDVKVMDRCCYNSAGQMQAAGDLMGALFPFRARAQLPPHPQPPIKNSWPPMKLT